MKRLFPALLLLLVPAALFGADFDLPIRGARAAGGTGDPK